MMFEDVEMVPERKTRARHHEDGQSEKYAQIAEAAFDDRPRSRSGHHSEADWRDGYREGTRAVAAAIRAASSPSVEQLHAALSALSPEDTSLKARLGYHDALDRDGCEFCLGAKGGTPGNENILHGHKICDYCSCLIDTPSPEDGFTVEQWRNAGESLSEAMEHGECTASELVRVVLDALGLPRIKPELILRDMLAKKP